MTCRDDAWTSWGTDPGPCPVDDTPHTACTPESVAALARGAVVAAVQRPRVLDRICPPPPVTFSTKTYRRKAHRPALRGPER